MKEVDISDLHGRWRQATRAVMVLLSLHGLPPSQIAELLECHPATAPRGGHLLWYQHLGQQDGTFRWNGPRTVGRHWSEFKNAFTQ